mmetsp:Transcript_11049/g.24741  ORF Transcript_11049/g.24741 Transcript_11049/m.24741 type:complete len:227 (-) Transcript_11049:508-1188(-)
MLLDFLLVEATLARGGVPITGDCTFTFIRESVGAFAALGAKKLDISGWVLCLFSSEIMGERSSTNCVSPSSPKASGCSCLGESNTVALVESFFGTVRLGDTMRCVEVLGVVMGIWSSSSDSSSSNTRRLATFRFITVPNGVRRLVAMMTPSSSSSSVSSLFVTSTTREDDDGGTAGLLLGLCGGSWAGDESSSSQASFAFDVGESLDVESMGSSVLYSSSSSHGIS